MESQQTKIQKIKEQIENLRQLRGVLDDTLISAKEMELLKQLQILNAETVETIDISENEEKARIISALSGSSSTIDGSVDNLNILTSDGNTLSVRSDQVSPDILLFAYLRSLATECDSLPLGVVDPRFAQPSSEEKISVSDIYTDLDVISPPAREQETRRSWSLRLARGDGGERVHLITAVAESDAKKLVLLGDAGSGKTTFINYLTYRVAQSYMENGANPLHNIFKGKLVIRLVLRNVATKIPLTAKQGTAQMLWDSIEADILGRLGEKAAGRLFPYLQKVLWEQGGIILFDGLDEVPQADQRRKYLLDAIQELIGSLHPDSRILLTARPYAYSDPAWQLPGFQVVALAPFNRGQIERFILSWHRAVAPIMHWDLLTSEKRSERLVSVLLEKHYIADLASRPLLLTLIATLHTSWGQLPEDRAELYEESVKLLLSRWERGREVVGQDGKIVIEPSFSRVLGISEDLLRHLLEELAYRTHTQQGQQKLRDNAPADISLGDILTVFSDYLPDDLNPKLLLSYLEARSGLLINRREGFFTFPHRSFQEYFTACYLANLPDFGTRMRELVWNDPEWWGEVCLLSIGKAKQGGLSNAINILNVLLPDPKSDIEVPDNPYWYLAKLVGQAIVELRLSEHSYSYPHYRAIVKRTVEWLTEIISAGHLPPRDRLAAGDALGVLGDSREGISIKSTNGIKYPDIKWMQIPEGKFTMGSSVQDKLANDDEFPEHEVSLDTFYISKYETTYAQFGLFVEENGYDTRNYWTTDGWNWRNGIDPEFFGNEVHYDEERRLQYLKWTSSRTVERRSSPFWWQDPQMGLPNRPVIGINWYEAMAYCQWLDQKLRLVDKFLLDEIILSETMQVRLPTEAEWEKAARGPMGFRWAWGSEWRDNICNTLEMGLNQTSTVGMFPESVNHYGLYDMTGNVFEYLNTGLGKRYSATPKFIYPYSSSDGREQTETPDIRTVRGGAWFFDKRNARCTMREWDYPIIFDQNTGFRIAIGKRLK